MTPTSPSASSAGSLPATKFIRGNDRISQLTQRPDIAAEVAQVRVGMAESEVIRRIGKPEVDARSSRKQGKDGKHWSYLPAAGDADTITTLTMVGGLVANVERKVVR